MTAPRPLQAHVWASALALLGATLLVRAVSFLPAVINPDESIFALAAREVVHGHLPYLTLFDNKPVGSTLIIAAAFELLGQSIFTVRLVGLLSVWLSAFLLALLGQRGGLGRLQGLFCGLCYIAYASTMGGFATLTEVLLTPFMVAAVLLLYSALAATAAFSRRMLLFSCAGLASGVAIAIKIVPIVPGFAAAGIVLLILVRRGSLRIVPAGLLGLVFALFGMLPMALAALVYARAGVLPEFLYSNFGFANAYSDIRPGPILAAQRLATMVDSLWPLLLLAAVGTMRFVRDRRGGERLSLLMLVAMVWLAGEIAAASASGHFWPHYFLSAIPPLTLMSAFGVRAIVDWVGIGGRRGRGIALLSAIAVLIPLERTQADAARELAAEKDVARQVARAILVASGGRTPTLFVTNYQLSALYSMTGAPLPPTRYAVAPHLFSRQSAMIEGNPRVEAARVLASRPDFIVIDRNDHLPGWAKAQFRATLDHYQRIYAAGSVEVYKSS